MDHTKLHYPKTHEWPSVVDTVCPNGLSQFPTHKLTDVLNKDIPANGDHPLVANSFSDIHSIPRMMARRCWPPSASGRSGNCSGRFLRNFDSSGPLKLLRP